jgi:branched-chain amino acid transport system substrate-binding protein
MKKLWIGIGIVVVALVIALIVTQTRKEPEEIKIGAILPLTGDFSSHGEDAKKGIDLAISEINNKGGINGKKIHVIYEDDKMQPSVGVSAFEKLIKIDKVPVVIGGIGSSVALAMAPIAQKNKVVLLSPTASNPKITYAGEYIFRIWHSDVYEGRIMAKFVYDKMNIRKIAVLYVNNDFGQGLEEVFKKEFEKLGGQVVFSESYEQGSVDFRAQLSKIKNINPEGIYLPGYYQEVAKIAVQIKEMGLKAKLFSTSPIENPDLIKLAKEACENIIYTRPAFDPQNPSNKYKIFSSSFKEKYGVAPGIAAAFSYDAVQVILHALSNLHVKDEVKGDMIQKALADIKNYEGVTGKFSFDENGDVIREMSFFTIKNGQFVPFNKEDFK